MKENNEWISISDMMAGLMMIFLIITVSYMVSSAYDRKNLEKKNRELRELNDKIGDVAKTFETLQLELYNDLIKEFSKDLTSWNATIDPDNTIRFKEPDVLFDSGKSQVKERFKVVLDDFFPRYVKILSQEKYKGDIEEIRIEGHTSSEWLNAKTLEERYLGNAALSQARAFEVLKYCFALERIKGEQDWLIKVLRANGLSFAKPLDSEEHSRRVEFRTLTRSHQKMLKILDLSKEL
ncbi:OmpA family protein [Wolinella succinogenes]|uniref:Z5895 PROTEIN n=1 Tax=Wolinella succinogenes (strain ATCC 29543 / DSM 1740 / CCUG 13145 / JCM 31913 / LMG 7466 / NCTC 11488 / FDC 602W) TaxID=273121 RepID=Q7M9I7_WOLSU|nr:OmpA family protein [Wolinella succinogenes]CAE09994.1 Z5895 PROTEIN [Wolinella succinogenes]VEG82207.1 Outer membrane protein and related peptidoglycan-associated (lipo)proteins [Wolinella succinogenes]